MAQVVNSLNRFPSTVAAPQRRIPHYSNLIFADGRVDPSVLCRIAANKVRNNTEGQSRADIFRALWLMARLMQSAILEERKRAMLSVAEQQARTHELEIALLTHKRNTAVLHEDRVYYHQQIAWRQSEIARLRTEHRRAA